MRRGSSLILVVAMLFTACAGDVSPDPVSATRPLVQVDALPAPDVTSQVATPSEPVTAPVVTLANGETVPLFEEIDRGIFTNPTSITNQFLPVQPGMRYVYEGFTREDGETIPHRLVFTVTDLTKMIDGINTVVIWDVDYSDGELVETELAFYAQDDLGNVWRMGEYPEEWEEGVFIEAASWIAGIHDAQAGIAMTSIPLVSSTSYSQGWGPEVGFTDRAFVDQVAATTCVPVDCYTGVLVTDEFNDEEPDAHQLKYYARGVGNVRVGWRGDDSSIEELELVEVIRLTADEMTQVRDAALLLEERAYILDGDVYGLTARAVAPAL